MEGATLGPWRIEGELGSGGMGTVYAAVAERPACGLPAGSRVALKIVHAHLLGTEGFFKRFLREAEIGRAVLHRNVVRTFEANALAHEGIQRHYLVMEYVEGQTLRHLLDDLGRVSEELCRHIGLRVARALRAIHRAGAVHRDLKPENVLITADHEVKVMDLGVAHLAEELVRLSRTGAFVGSVRYAAPEQFRSAGGEIDARADLYALGIVLYELACGRHPHGDGDLRATIVRILDEEPCRLGERNPQLSPFLEELVHTLLVKDREGRFPTSDAVVRALEGGEESEWWRRRIRAIRRETRRPLRRIRIPRATSVYGRDDELGRLRRWFDEARAGRGQVVLLEGEAGIGKTRLVDEFVGRLRQEGEELAFLFGAFPPGGAATAAGAFVTAFREHLGEEDLDAELATRLDGAESLVPAFAALLRGEPPPAGAASLTKDSLQTAFAAATASLARERPIVLLIDDLHFTSDEGRGLFAALAHAAAGHRILLVGTARRGLPGEWLADVERLPQFSRLPLARLGAKDLGRLLIEAFGSERLARELALPIATKSDGNPFFVFEIVQELRESGVLAEQPDGTFRTTRSVDRIRIPTSVRDLIRARVADLSEEDRELLDVAACCGFTFDGALVADVLELPRVTALRRLAHLEAKHGIVRSVGRRFVFDHHQIQEVLYEGMPEPLREVYHAGLAAALESRGGPDAAGGADPAEICRHYLEGGDPRAAARHLRPALRSLEAALRRDAALDLACRLLDAPGVLEGEERLAVLIEVVAMLDTLGRREEEEERLAQASALAERVGDPALRARVRAGRGWFLIGTDRFEEARELLEEALALARESGDRAAEAEATRDLGVALYCLRRLPEAMTTHEHHLALAREIGDRRGAASSVGNLGNVLFTLGRLEEAREKYEEWLAASRRIGSRRGEAAATGNLGSIHFLRGRYEEARAHHERNRELCRQIGYRLGESRATGWLGWTLHALGRYAEAGRELAEYREMAVEVGHGQGEVLAETALARLALDLGDAEEAEERARAAVRRAESLGLPASRAGALLWMGAILAALARPGEAEPLLREALALHREADRPADAAETLIALAGAVEAGGGGEDPRGLLEEAAALAARADDAGTAVLAAARLACLPGGDAAAAGEAFARLESRLTHGERLRAAWLLWRATGEESWRAAARRLLEERLAEVPAERRAEARSAVPLHREVGGG